MRATAISIVGALALYGCAREADHAASPTSKPTASPVAITAAGSASPAHSPSGTGPSYEVAIASAQADRVHALNGCDARQGAPRVACVRAADQAYDEARESAQKIRGSGR